MALTLSKVDISNIALSEIGAQSIDDFDDTQNTSAVAVKINWQLALAEVSRAAQWNCLMATAVLTPTVQEPLPDAPVNPPTTPWAPFTVYVANQYVTYGLQIYQAFYNNTSTNNFINDLTAGYWFETDITDPNPSFGGSGYGGNYPSNWAYQYPLPGDCILVCSYNQQQPSPGQELTWQIIGINLYSNQNTAVIKYIQYNEDCTRYDALFTACLVSLLASKIATRLRQDDTQIASGCYAKYLKKLADARTTNGGEQVRRRFTPQANSRWINSRFRSTNG